MAVWVTLTTLGFVPLQLGSPDVTESHDRVGAVAVTVSPDGTWAALQLVIAVVTELVVAPGWAIA